MLKVRCLDFDPVEKSRTTCHPEHTDYVISVLARSYAPLLHWDSVIWSSDFIVESYFTDASIRVTGLILKLYRNNFVVMPLNISADFYPLGIAIALTEDRQIW